MTLSNVWDHVRELLIRLRIMISVFVIVTIAVLIVPIDLESLYLSWTNPNYSTLATVTITRLISDFLPPDVELLPLDWFAPFTVYINVSLFLAVIISSPVIIYEIYKFVNPALYENERKLVVLFVGSFTLLFLFGVTIGYMLIIPVTFRMLLGITYLLGLIPRYDFTSFFSIILGGVLITGLFFTFPVFYLTLIRAGILKTSMLSRARKIIYLAAFIVICIITPDPSLLSDILLFFPMVILMEASQIIGKNIEKNRLKK